MAWGSRTGSRVVGGEGASSEGAQLFLRLAGPGKAGCGGREIGR